MDGAWTTKRRNRRTPPPHSPVQGQAAPLAESKLAFSLTQISAVTIQSRAPLVEVVTRGADVVDVAVLMLRVVVEAACVVEVCVVVVAA